MQAVPSPMHDAAQGPRLSRRSLLVGAASGLVLAACGGDGSTDGAATASPGTAGSGAPVAASDAAGTAVAAAGLQDADAVLAPQVLWSELVVEQPEFLQFVAPDTSADNDLVTEPMQVWLVREGEVVAGPLTSQFHADDRIPSGGLHSVAVEVGAAGLLDVVVAAGDGRRVGTGAVQAIAAADSIAPAQGTTLAAVGTAAANTPTVAQPGDLEELCTADPDCPLHDVTLADALADGVTVLCIATPKFCSTAICGPVLEDVVTVATSGEHPDVTFVHVEPYVDAGETVTELMTALALPTEPWTFVLEPDGTITHRFPGPVVPELLGEALGALEV